MKTFAVLCLNFAICVAGFSAPSIQWSQNISELVDLTDYDISLVYPYQFQSFSDGSCAILIPNKNSGDPALLLVLDPDGNEVFSSTNTFGYSVFTNLPSSQGRFSILDNSGAENIGLVRFFEENEGSYISYDLSLLGVSTITKYIGTSLFSLSETTVSKYRFEDDLPTLVGSVSGVEDGNYIVSWDSDVDVQYQIQKSLDLVSWSPIGATITGTGGTQSWSTPVGTTPEFYRIVLP